MRSSSQAIRWRNASASAAANCTPGRWLTMSPSTRPPTSRSGLMPCMPRRKADWKLQWSPRKYAIFHAKPGRPVVIGRGELWWADLPEPVGSAPGYRRPVLIVQNDTFNRSRIATVTVVALTSNVRLLDAPGNVLIPAQASGLPRDSVANVSQVLTVNRDLLTELLRSLSPSLIKQVNEGLRFALDLQHRLSFME